MPPRRGLSATAANVPAEAPPAAAKATAAPEPLSPLRQLLRSPGKENAVRGAARCDRLPAYSSETLTTDGSPRRAALRRARPPRWPPRRHR